MRTNKIKINSEVIYLGIRYLVISIDPPNVMLKRIDGDYACISLDFIQLATNICIHNESLACSEIKPSMDSNKSLISGIDEHKKEIVYKRFEIIKPLILLENVKRNDTKALLEFIEYYNHYIFENEDLKQLKQETLIDRIGKHYNVSSRTIKRYISAYRKFEKESQKTGLEGLAPKSGDGYAKRNDNKILYINHPKKSDIILDSISLRIDERYLPIIKEVIENEYLTVKQVSKKATYDSIKVKCFIEGIEPPKMITIYKLIERIDPQVKSRMRNSKEASAIYDDIQRGFSNQDALYPLHIIEIDHTELDMDIIDENTGYVIGRPWITLGIDVYSRMVWCMYVSFEPPSANRVRKALQHGIFFKDSKKYNTINNWDIFGIPNTIFLDNGPDFKSAEVKRMINDTLRAHVRYRPVKTPRYGGTIERLFGTINAELIHRLDGTRKSNVRKLGEYNPEKEACLTLEDITELLTIYITDIYHFSEHKGLPINESIPMIRYLEGIKRVGYPEYIDKNDEQAYKIELMATEMKPYTRDGVRLDNILYKSPYFSEFIGNRNIKYKIKYDIDDISKIYILNPKIKEYIELPAVLPSADVLKNVNKYTYKKLVEIARENGVEKSKGVLETENVVKAMASLQETIIKKYKKNRNIRKQSERSNFEVNISIDENKSPTKKLSLADIISRAKQIEKERSK